MWAVALVIVSWHYWHYWPLNVITGAHYTLLMVTQTLAWSPGHPPSGPWSSLITLVTSWTGDEKTRIQLVSKQEDELLSLKINLALKCLKV